MPRSFLINDKPKGAKADRHRSEEEPSDMDTDENPDLGQLQTTPVTVNSTPCQPRATPSHQSISVNSLPYSIAKLTGCEDEDDGAQGQAPESTTTSVTIPSTSTPQAQPSNCQTSNNHTTRTPAKLPMQQGSTASASSTFAHHLTSSSHSLHQAFAFSHAISSTPYLPATTRPSLELNPPPSVCDNIPPSGHRDSKILRQSTTPLVQPDYTRHLQSGPLKGDTHNSNMCQTDKQQTLTYVPNVFPSSLPSNFPIDSGMPGNGNMQRSSPLPPFTHIKPSSAGHHMKARISAPQPGSVTVQPQFNPYVNPLVQVSTPPTFPAVFQPSPPRATLPSSPSKSPLNCRSQPDPTRSRSSLSPIEVPRSSTPAVDGRRQGEPEPDLSVVSTELDRSSDSGLDSGHQSSDFDGEAEAEEEQIDVVGDGDGDDLHDEEEALDLHDDADEEDDESDHGHEDDHHDLTVTPLPIIRPQPKRSGSDIRHEPISPASSSSSLSPGSAAGPYNPDFFRLNDPRFWPSSLPSLSHPYLPGMNSMTGNLPLPHHENFPGPRTPPGGRPSPGVPGFQIKQGLPFPQGVNQIARPGSGMGKHPFMPFPHSLFSGMFRGDTMGKQPTSNISPPLPPTSLHQGFPASAPRPGLPLSHTNGPLAPAGHLQAHKTRPTAPTLPWLLDLPGFGLNKDGSMDRPPIRKANEPPRYQCDACKKSYATFSGLSKHKQFHCESHIKKEFSCKYCDKRYTSLGALKMHIRTHTLPCKCQICGKAFSRPWLLQGHIRTHTGEKPFSCQHCNRAFADRSNLRAHLQTHSDIKKYSCKSCTKTFSRMSLLLKHEENSCPGTRPAMVPV